MVFGDSLTSFIEAGETENLYFRVIIPCKPLLRMYVTSHFEKPKMFWEAFNPETLSWVKQTFVDASQYCPAPPAAATPPSPKKRKR